MTISAANWPSLQIVSNLASGLPTKMTFGMAPSFSELSTDTSYFALSPSSKQPLLQEALDVCIWRSFRDQDQEVWMFLVPLCYVICYMGTIGMEPDCHVIWRPSGWSQSGNLLHCYRSSFWSPETSSCQIASVNLRCLVSSLLHPVLCLKASIMWITITNSQVLYHFWLAMVSEMPLQEESRVYVCCSILLYYLTARKEQGMFTAASSCIIPCDLELQAVHPNSPKCWDCSIVPSYFWTPNLVLFLRQDLRSGLEFLIYPRITLNSYLS